MVTLSLDEARALGDPEADAVIAEFAADHPGITPRDVVGAMSAELRSHPDARHERVGQYLLGGTELPSWVDGDQVVRGQRFFRDYGLFIGASLFCASLPDAYAAADGVEVLAITAELVSHPRRRIAETGRFLVDVMALDGAALSLAPGGRGYHAVRGVRLMHAAVRALVTAEQGPEWIAQHGVPVNQRDLVGTLCTFTSVVYAAMDKLGVEYDAEGAEAHLHTWCAIGHLLGIEDDLLPWSRAEADNLAALLRTQLHRSSPGGTLLMRALLDELEEFMPWGCKAVPRTVVRYLLDDETADLLDVPAPSRLRAVLGGMRDLGGTHGPSAAAYRSLCNLVGRSLYGEYIQRGLEGTHAPFEVPDDVIAHWKLQSGRVGRATQRRRSGQTTG